ncbi:hypothetical protein AMELA_G00004410 [Ameiurus melas]|uniref:Uncharacterized protein n=1 Tax=Ameiurus melas TaxID=219545 RepID=A0A7J6BHR6_AMEME|nr:hypothetical protein AMELA_G00004410 [Ameiurus melas]
MHGVLSPLFFTFALLTSSWEWLNGRNEMNGHSAQSSQGSPCNIARLVDRNKKNYSVPSGSSGSSRLRPDEIILDYPLGLIHAVFLNGDDRAGELMNGTSHS